MGVCRRFTQSCLSPILHDGPLLSIFFSRTRDYLVVELGLSPLEEQVPSWTPGHRGGTEFLTHGKDEKGKAPRGGGGGLGCGSTWACLHLLHAPAT